MVPTRLQVTCSFYTSVVYYRLSQPILKPPQTPYHLGSTPEQIIYIWRGRIGVPFIRPKHRVTRILGFGKAKTRTKANTQIE